MFKILFSFIFLLLINISFAQQQNSYVEMNTNENNSGYIQLPAGNISGSQEEFSFDGWVYWTGGNNWQRIFDFGSGTARNMFFTPQSDNGYPRFAITTYEYWSESKVFGNTYFPINQWVHVAIVIKSVGYDAYGFIYINGVMSGVNLIYTQPNHLGETNNNYFGKSQYNEDENFRGKIDGFRIWTRALSDSEIEGFYQNNSSVPINENGLWAYYKMDENSGTLINDLTGRLSEGNLIGNSFIVSPNNPPNLLNAQIENLFVNENCQVELTPLNVTGVFDPDGDPVTLTFSDTLFSKGEYSVIVTATDNKGAYTSLEMTVTVLDTTKPYIELPNSVELLLGLDGNVVYYGAEIFTEDNCSQNIVLTSSPSLPISYSQEGNYFIIYTAIDESGNQNSVIQNIIVIKSNASEIVSAVNQLSSLQNITGQSQQFINNAVQLLNNAKSPEYWLSPNNLNEENGIEVFDLTREALLKLLPVLNMKGKNALSNVEKEKVLSAIISIVRADSALAANKILELSVQCSTSLCNSNINKAYKDMEKANSFFLSGNYQVAIEFYSKAWLKVRSSSNGINKELSEDENSNIPQEFVLSQNYPNPFNPSTEIRFQITEDRMVSLIVYDVLGNEVTTLVNEYKTAGSYNINFSAGSLGNASNLSSGVYYYKLTAGDFVSVKKMMLLK